MNKLFPELNIPGLKLIESFIIESEETDLLKNINNHTWLNDLTRKVQHYGYKYDYKSRKITNLGGINNFPNWLQELNNKITKELSLDFNSCIITLPQISTMPQSRGAKLISYAQSAAHTFQCSGADLIGGRGAAFAATTELPLRTLVVVYSFGTTSWVIQ